MSTLDNRAAGAAHAWRQGQPPAGRPKGAGRPPLRVHFRFAYDGRQFAYCRIRKNGCSAMQRFLIATSPYRALDPARGLEFLKRHHAVPSHRALEAADGRILIVRDPVERIRSVYVNKFIQKKGYADLFGSYRAVTGRTPEEASLEDFVFDYVARLGDVALDPHVWPQIWHLSDTVYDHVFSLEALHEGMAEIIGGRPAAQFFRHRVNTSAAVSLPVPAAVRDAIERLYAEDIAMIGRIVGGSGRVAGGLERLKSAYLRLPASLRAVITLDLEDEVPRDMDYDPFIYWNSRRNPNRSYVAPAWIIQHVTPHTAGLSRIFELGPGIGRTFEIYAPGQSVVTLDLSRQYAEALRLRAEARGVRLSQHFLPDPAAAFPFADGAFELGVCLQVLMHVPPGHIAHTMGELARVSRRTVVIAGVSPNWAGQAAHCFNHDYPGICRAIGCVAEAAVARQDSICFVLRRAVATPGRLPQAAGARDGDG